jgi:hypothetical protein
MRLCIFVPSRPQLAFAEYRHGFLHILPLNRHQTNNQKKHRGKGTGKTMVQQHGSQRRQENHGHTRGICFSAASCLDIPLFFCVILMFG